MYNRGLIPAPQRCVRFAVGVAWTRAGAPPAGARYACRRWDPAAGTWGAGRCGPAAVRAADAAPAAGSPGPWNATDAMVERISAAAAAAAGVNGTGGGGNGTGGGGGPAVDIVGCECDSDGLYTVEVLLPPPGPDGSGLRCLLTRRRAASRPATDLVVAVALVLSSPPPPP
jgi:hypothetical protein